MKKTAIVIVLCLVAAISLPVLTISAMVLSINIHDCVWDQDLARTEFALRFRPSLVSARDKYGNTPLHHAKDPAIAELLLRHGADVNARSREGNTPLHGAVTAELAKVLLDHGASVDAENSYGETPLDMKFNRAILPLLEAAREGRQKQEEGEAHRNSSGADGP